MDIDNIAGIDLENIAVVVKRSVVEVDMQKFSLDEKGLRERYSAEKKPVERFFGSHFRQLRSRELLYKLFPEKVHFREVLTLEFVASKDLIVAAGGDDHLKYVTHYVNSVPVLGLNTDPVRSRGELLEDDIARAVRQLEAGNYTIEDQTRIGCVVNGIPHMVAMSNYPVKRYTNPFGNYRHEVEFKGKKTEHSVTTGISAFTGNGMNDWPKGAGRYAATKPVLSPTDRSIGWIVHEPQELYDLHTGLVVPGEELVITCYKDDSCLAPDAVVEHLMQIKSGDVIKFRVSDNPLRKIIVR